MDDTVRCFDAVINDLREVDVKIVIIPLGQRNVAALQRGYGGGREIKRRTNTHFAIEHVVCQDVSQRFWVCQQRIKRACR